MDSQTILFDIKKVFGIYSRPKHIGGFPRESWQDVVEHTPLEKIDIDTLLKAVRHVFPSSYMDVNVFRYLLSRILPYFISYPENQKSNTFNNVDEYNCDDEWWSDTSEINTIENIIQVTAEFCVRWKAYLKQEEVSVIDRVFNYASLISCCKEQKISSFFFTLFLLWEKNYKKMFSYIESNYSEEAIGILWEEGRKVILFFKDVPNMLPLYALLGIYYYNEEIMRDKDSESISFWFENSINLAPIQIPSYFTEEDIKLADKEIVDFFKINV